ncbi:hypothetical protein LCGC14_0235100 [marine sediment metagenome]|uniref:Uncharacterized protein n=1 Tax=marine sediment metagenome TaxID=412755 RepID=A0A0F9UDC1_9ZZZZ
MGHYTGELTAVYDNGIPIGFKNSSFMDALDNQPTKHTGPECGKRFEAFVIEEECPTMKRID